MDDFEKEYFIKLKQLAVDYQDKRLDLAKSRIKMFAAALARQLIDEGEQFDLIVTAGNSGLYMAEITKMVYQSLKIKHPKVITLPIFRFKELNGQPAVNDNSYLKSEISGKLSFLPKKANVLFVDDETMSGLTIKAVLDLILGERYLELLRCLIIAENHFFEWHFNLSNVSINYFAYSRLIQGLNGNIGYLVSENLYNQIVAQINDVESYNHAMSIVIGGALKRKDEKGKPYFDSSVSDLCKKNILGFEQIKSDLISELKDLVKQGIEEYKNKTIKFRF